jgi:hypothetical protein
LSAHLDDLSGHGIPDGDGGAVGHHEQGGVGLGHGLPPHPGDHGAIGVEGPAGDEQGRRREEGGVETEKRSTESENLKMPRSPSRRGQELKGASCGLLHTLYVYIPPIPRTERLRGSKNQYLSDLTRRGPTFVNKEIILGAVDEMTQVQ